jgi:hypothetical protein
MLMTRNKSVLVLFIVRSGFRAIALSPLRG